MYNLGDGKFSRHDPKLVVYQHAKEVDLTWIHENERRLILHKKDLEETEKIIENARAKGWQRQVEKNVPRAERLKKIVQGMEKHKNMKGLGHNEWEKE